MITALNRKSLETMRDGLLDGAGSAWEQARRVEFRTPWIYRKPLRSSLGAKPWLIGVLVFTAVLTSLAAFLYFRKRNRVADNSNPKLEKSEAVPVLRTHQDENFTVSTPFATS